MSAGEKKILLPTTIVLAEDKHIIKLFYAILSTKIINLSAHKELATCILRNNSELVLERELCIIICTHIHEND